MTNEDLEMRKGLKGTKVNLLTSELSGIIGSGLDSGGKILDAGNRVFWAKHGFAEGLQVEPFVGSAFDGPIVKVEGIHIHKSLHSDAPQKKQEPILSERLCALSPKLPGLFLDIE